VMKMNKQSLINFWKAGWLNEKDKDDLINILLNGEDTTPTEIKDETNKIRTKIEKGDD